MYLADKRLIKVSSSTSSAITFVNGFFKRLVIPSRSSACTVVLGKPSKMKPSLISGWLKRSSTNLAVTSSGTKLPLSM